MRIRNIELWLALAAILGITVLYLGVVAVTAVPRSSGLIGHSLGIVGFIMMLMTEILYSVRKRYMLARWGKMKHWLNFHIFTGLVGPYMVLLHTSFKFNGLAGVLTLMTIIIVISGFVGRYFYTAIPRSPEGAALEGQQVQELLETNREQIQRLQESRPELHKEMQQVMGANGLPKTGWLARMERQRRWRALESSLTGLEKRLVANLSELVERQLELQRQAERINTARRLLAVWHTVHIPLGVATFTVAFIHIGAVLYYATLAR